MEAEYIEKYDKLRDLQPGQVAVSANREKLFICVWAPNQGRSDSHKTIFDLRDPTNQYVFHQDMNQPIKKLERGDKFIFTV